jgi:hypothetical protein
MNCIPMLDVCLENKEAMIMFRTCVSALLLKEIMIETDLSRLFPVNCQHAGQRKVFWIVKFMLPGQDDYF